MGVLTYSSEQLEIGVAVLGVTCPTFLVRLSLHFPPSWLPAGTVPSTWIALLPPFTAFDVLQT